MPVTIGPIAARRTRISPLVVSMLMFITIANPPKIPDQIYVARKYTQGEASKSLVVLLLSFTLFSPCIQMKIHVEFFLKHQL